MSDTIVDMPKVAQMLDAGWCVRIFKGDTKSYEARASHPRRGWRKEIIKKLATQRGEHHMVFQGMTLAQTIEECHFDGDELMTDDFTPEQALTRMAYKVFGEIL